MRVGLWRVEGSAWDGECWEEEESQCREEGGVIDEMQEKGMWL